MTPRSPHAPTRPTRGGDAEGIPGQYGLVTEVLRALAGSADLSGILHRCAEAMVSHLGAAFARIWTVDASGDMLELQASAGMYTHLDGPHSRVPIGSLKIGLIAEQRSPHLTNDVLGDDRVSDKAWARREGMVAFAGYPLLAGEKLMGVLAMFSRHKLASDALDALASVADSIALGIQRATAEQRVREEARIIETLYGVSTTLAGNLDLAGVTQTAIDAVTGLTGADFGAFLYSVDDEEGGTSVFRAVSGAGAPALNDRLAGGGAMPMFEHAFTRLGVVRIHDTTTDDRWNQMPAVERSTLDALAVRSFLVVPVVSPTGSALGGIFLGHARPDAFPDRAERLAVGIAGTASLAIDNARLYRSAQLEIAKRRLAEDTQHFLADAGTTLSKSLEYPGGYRRLAKLAVPFLADLCLIDVVAGDRIERMAAVHADPSKEALVRELHDRFPPEPNGRHPSVEVIRTGSARFAHDMTPEFLEATTRGPDHLRVVTELGFTSYMCLPLAARGRTLGALTLVSSGSGRRFGPDDVALAEDLARRAALVLDNSRLLDERTHVARTLQASLLPPSLPEIPGMEVAARYQASGGGDDVGGDFYDAFAVSDRTWVVLVGDVCGKGPEAAAVAGLARHVLRAGALREREPSRILTLLHEALRREPIEERFCSVCLGLLEATETGARLVFSGGGHPLPLVLRAAGGVETVECRGTVLGLVDPVVLNDQSIDLGPGDAVVLYTDGVTEEHPEGELFGEARLAALLNGLAGVTAEGIADGILESVRRFASGKPRDDVAVLALRLHPGT